MRFVNNNHALELNSSFLLQYTAECSRELPGTQAAIIDRRTSSLVKPSSASEVKTSFCWLPMEKRIIAER